MLILLPNEKEGLKVLEEKLQEIDLQALQDEMHMYDTVLALPRFKIDFDINLNGPLKKVRYDKI